MRLENNNKEKDFWEGIKTDADKIKIVEKWSKQMIEKTDEPYRM